MYYFLFLYFIYVIFFVFQICIPSFKFISRSCRKFVNKCDVSLNKNIYGKYLKHIQMKNDVL